MKKIVFVGNGKKSLILDILKKNENKKIEFESENKERKKNMQAKANIIIEKNQNAFED